MAQLVEHDLAKVGAAGSSPVSRSLKAWCLPGFFLFVLHFVLHKMSKWFWRLISRSIGRSVVKAYNCCVFICFERFGKFFFGAGFCFPFFFRKIGRVSVFIKLFVKSFRQSDHAVILVDRESVQSMTGSGVDTGFVIRNRICCSKAFDRSDIFDFFADGIVYVACDRRLISETVVINRGSNK